MGRPQNAGVDALHPGALVGFSTLPESRWKRIQTSKHQIGSCSQDYWVTHPSLKTQREVLGDSEQSPLEQLQ